VLRALLSFLVIAGLGAAWWYSRPIVEQDPTLGTVTYRRLLGRIVAVESDSDRDGRPEVVTEYPFSAPFERQAVPEACPDWSPHAEDRDGDGRPDTWYRAVGDDGAGRCLYAFEADVDLDGRPDWSMESTDRAEAYTRMAQLRGF
jgi:hypothetical protein